MSMLKFIPSDIEFADSLSMQMRIHDTMHDGYEFKSRGPNPVVYVSFIDSILREDYIGILMDEKEYMQWVLGFKIGDILDEILLYNIKYYPSSKYIRKEVRPLEKYSKHFTSERLPYLTRIG